MLKGLVRGKGGGKIDVAIGGRGRIHPTHEPRKYLRFRSLQENTDAR
jgi:hypothetical protein